MKTKNKQPQTKPVASGAAELPSYRQTSANREAHRRAARLAKRVGVADHYDWVFVIRESDQNAVEEWGGLMKYTLNPWVSKVPGVEVILGHGTALVAKDSTGDALRATYNAKTLLGGVTGRKVIGWVLEHEGSLYVISLFSAAKTNERESNDFTDALSDIVERHSVAHLVVGNFSRAVRAREHATRLYNACRFARAVIHTSGYDIDLADDRGRDAFDNEVDEAVIDYKRSVDRLQRGAHTKLFDGEWAKEEHALPTSGLAYKFRDSAPGARTQNRTVVPKVEHLELVRDVLTWGASDLTNYQIAERIAAKHGWGSDILRRRLNNPKATILDARNPAAVVRSIWRHLDLFATGLYEIDQRVPSPTKIKRDTRYEESTYDVGDTKFLRVDLSFHHDLLPGGRWVEPEIIELCRQKRLTEKGNQGRGTAVSDRKPLTGLPGWVEDPFEWRFSSWSHSTYQLARRPMEAATDAAGKPLGWRYDDKDIIAVVDPAELHRSLAHALADAVSKSGVTISRVGVRKTEQKEAPDLSELETAMAVLSKAAKRARTAYSLAVELYDEAETDAHRAALKEAFAEKAATEEALREAEAEYALIVGQVKASAPLTSEVQVQVRDLATALALLAKTDEKAPGDLALALSTFLVEFRAKVSSNRTKVEFSTSLLVETDEGPVTLGPVQVSVANIRRRDAQKTRRSALLEAVFKEGLSIDEARARLNLADYYHTRRLVRQEITKLKAIPSRDLVVAALDCPIKETKLVLWYLFESKRTGEPFEVPAGIDPAFAAHVLKTYGKPDVRWSFAWAADTHTTLRRSIEAVRAAGEDGADWGTFVADVLPGIAECSLRTATDALATGTTTRSGNEFAPVLARSKKWRAAERKVWVRPCPYCGTRSLDHVLRVPEVAGGIICSSCRRVPTLPTVVFPEDYLRAWSSPRTSRETGEGQHGTFDAEMVAKTAPKR